MEMNNNINDERVKYWQDHFDNVLWSRGMLLFCNTLIVMVMLIYSYTADPASNDEINICRDVFKNNTNTDYDCLNIYDKLQISQSNACSSNSYMGVVESLKVHHFSAIVLDIFGSGGKSYINTWVWDGFRVFVELLHAKPHRNMMKMKKKVMSGPEM